MCAVSMVYNHYNDRFPLSPSQTIPWKPAPLTMPPPEIAELRQLIAEFREALIAARRVDVLTHQPDCFDPKKTTLEDRVAELERRLAIPASAAPDGVVVEVEPPDHA